MTGTMKTLSRIVREELDIKLRSLNTLQNQRDAMLLQRQKLRDALQEEESYAAGSGEVSYTFQNYVAYVKKRDLRIGKSLAELDKQISVLYEAITSQFAELKRYELLDAARARREEEEEKAAEQKELDEIALMGHQRKETPQ